MRLTVAQMHVRDNIQQKLFSLGRIAFESDGALPVLYRGTESWLSWRDWRIEWGLPVSFMDSQVTWTVPQAIPPVWDKPDGIRATSAPPPPKHAPAAPSEADRAYVMKRFHKLKADMVKAKNSMRSDDRR